jgi:hypothetical protein
VTTVNGEGSAHFWHLKEYCRYISRGTCICGAVRFFANDPMDKEQLQLAEHYNRKKGKEGSGHTAALPKKEGKTMTKQEEHSAPTFPIEVSHNAGPLSPAKKGPPGKSAEDLLKMRELWGKKCLTCTSAYEVEGVRYCPVKRCPSRIPEKLRPPYRLKGKSKPEFHRSFKVQAPPATEETPPEPVEPPPRKFIILKPGEKYEPPPPPEEETECRIFSCAHCGDKFGTREKVFDHIKLCHGPKFPAFNESWPWPVKIAWLLIFSKLAGKVIL